jgi:hypothetical protein
MSTRPCRAASSRSSSPTAARSRCRRGRRRPRRRRSTHRVPRSGGSRNGSVRRPRARSGRRRFGSGILRAEAVAPGEQRDRHQRERRSAVRIGRLTGVELAEILAQHPERQRQRQPERDGGRPGRSRKRADSDQGLRLRQEGDQQRSMMCRPGGRRPVQTGEPRGRAAGPAGQRARDRLAAVMARQGLEEGPAHPHPGPGELQPGSRALARAVPAWPGRAGQERIDQRRAGRPGDQACVAARQPGEALAEVPHSQRPGDRDRERRPGGAGRQQPDPDQELDWDERRVPRDRMGRDDGRGPVDRVRDEPRLPLSSGGDHLRREAAREHEGLRLERTVEQPERPERDPEVASRDARAGGDGPDDLARTPPLRDRCDGRGRECRSVAGRWLTAGSPCTGFRSPCSRGAGSSSRRCSRRAPARAR